MRLVGCHSQQSASFPRRLARFLSSGTKTQDAGYKSIGSFHSENLDDIMARPKKEYEAPSLPFLVDQATLPTTPSKSDFMIDFDRWTFLNHGAFGGALKTGYDRASDWRLHLERQPLRYFDRDLLPHLAFSARRLANFTNAPDRSNVALLPNVTSGLNSVLSGHVRMHGDVKSHCVLWDTTYGSVKKMANIYYNGNVTEIPFQQMYIDKLAASSDPEQVFQEALEYVIGNDQLCGKEICFILDQTTSNTALNMPIANLASQIKSTYAGDSLVVVDGAHGMLAQHVDISEMFENGVDVYLSNGHKWLAAPRGVGFLVATDELVHAKPEILKRPAVISHGVDEPGMLSRFVWDGCRDYAAALSIPAVLDYWEAHNPRNVRSKCKDGLRDGIKVLAKEWHDNMEAASWPGHVTLADFDSSLTSPMALVRLPSRFGSQRTSVDAKRIQDHLFSQHIEIPIKCINGNLYTRVSFQVYNDVSDFQVLAKTVADFC